MQILLDPSVLESMINADDGVRDFDTQTPLAGLGYGKSFFLWKLFNFFGGLKAVMHAI